LGYSCFGLIARSCRDVPTAALHSKDRRDYPHLGVLPEDLYIQFEPWPRIGRPPKHDVAEWTVTDDWPRRVPVTEAEVDVFEAWGVVKVTAVTLRLNVRHPIQCFQRLCFLLI
jgi:hypothetical protein